MGSGDGADQLRAAAASLDDAELESARFGFHRAFPRRSAKRVLHVTQALWLLALGAGLVWALREHTALTLHALHLLIWFLFAAAILWRLIAAANLAPALSRLAAPERWPIYTVLCPLYHEANVTPDLVAALGKLDYPGMETQSNTPLAVRIALP